MRFYSLRLQGQDGQNLLELPATYKVYGSRFTAWTLVVAGFVFGLEGVYESIRAGLMTGLTASIVDLIWTAFFFVFVTIGISLFRVDGQLTIRNGRVSCAYRSITGDKQWDVPIASYDGLCTRRTTEGTGRRTIKWTVTLVHPEADKSVLLFKAGAREFADEAMAMYRQMFRLPDISADRRRFLFWS